MILVWWCWLRPFELSQPSQLRPFREDKIFLENHWELLTKIYQICQKGGLLEILTELSLFFFYHIYLFFKLFSPNYIYFITCIFSYTISENILKIVKHSLGKQFLKCSYQVTFKSGYLIFLQGSLMGWGYNEGREVCNIG